MSLPLHVNPEAGTPIYQQIMAQLKHAIGLGVYPPDSPIPTIREMALQLKVNPNTVAKAVRELEREGILVTRVGKGSFVAAEAVQLTQSDQLGKAAELAHNYGKDMRWLGFDKPQSVRLVEENWEE